MMNDLATLDQAIQVYRLDNGEAPGELGILVTRDYVARNAGFTDAKGKPFDYKPSGTTYNLTGTNTKEEKVFSYGSVNYEKPKQTTDGGGTPSPTI